MNNILSKNIDIHMIMDAVYYMNVDNEHIISLHRHMSLLRNCTSLFALLRLANSYAFFALSNIPWSNKDVK